jgi:hypothetical protein
MRIATTFAVGFGNRLLQAQERVVEASVAVKRSLCKGEIWWCSYRIFWRWDGAAQVKRRRLDLGGVHEDAQHPGALPALEAKCSGGGRVEDRDSRNRRQ